MIRALVPLFSLVLVAATPHRLPPVEHCTGDAGFDRFRAALKRAVAVRDPAGLKRLVAPDITVNFGGDSGWADFAAAWGLATQARTSKVWDEMARAMALGCARTPDGRRRVMPGMFAAVGDEVDIFDLVAVRPGTPLRDKAGGGGRVIAMLDWDAGEIQTGGDPQWARLKLLDGRSGWVATDRLVSPVGYRLVTERRNGRWLITAFVAGD